MRSDALRFAKERYFNGYSDSRSVQEKFNLITSFIQDSDKHIYPIKNKSFCLLSTFDNSYYKKEDSQKKMQLMQKQKSQVVQKSEQNLKL